MGESSSVKKTEICACEVPGAEQEDDDLCLHYFTELDISSSETDPDNLDSNELESDADNHSSIFHNSDKNDNIFTQIASDSDDPLSPNPNSSPLPGENSSNYSPSAKQLTSAMKGSREKEGKIITKSKFTVKWAPDVYDPPVTSDDHTRKHVSYKPRIKNAKKEYYYKQKYAKSKGSNGKSERKRTSHSSSKSSSNKSKINDPRMIRLLAKHGKTLPNNYQNSPPKSEELHGQSKIVCEKKTNELKFGSSFCRELVSCPLHRSLAEAS